MRRQLFTSIYPAHETFEKATFQNIQLHIPETFNYRYQLYGQWKSQSYYTQPELIAARLGTLKRAKYIFSRLTKDNVKQQGRLIGKLSHANPVVFFEYVSDKS